MPLAPQLAALSARLAAALAPASTRLTFRDGDTPVEIEWTPPRELPPDGSILADLVDALPDAVVALDAGGRVLLWTPAAAALFGWPASDVTARPPRFVPSAALLAFQRTVAAARTGARVRNVPLALTGADARSRDVRLSAAPDAAGNVVLVIRPAADGPAAEPTRAAAVSPRLETLGRLAEGVAHDVNNVLAVVAGTADLLAEAGAPADAVAAIRAAARHAAGLTRRVLAFAAAPERCPVAMCPAAVLADLAPLVRAVIGAGVRYAVRADATRRVWADPTQVEQVVLNLAANARDAMPNGGTLRVRTADVAVAPGRRGWPAGRGGWYVCLTVADTGTGIDDPTMARLFDPYFTTKAGGTGLGLATVRDAVARLGGHLEVDSDPARGTVFRAYLPAAAASDTVADDR